MPCFITSSFSRDIDDPFGVPPTRYEAVAQPCRRTITGVGKKVANIEICTIIFLYNAMITLHIFNISSIFRKTNHESME